MHALRAFLRSHRRLATSLVMLALAMKLLVPAGYMVGGKAHVLTVEVCGDSSGGRLVQEIVIPHDGAPDHAGADGPCAWSAAGMPVIGGADAPLLALALAFLLLLGYAPIRRVRPSRSAHVRPPLRGPPAFA